jgi:hypothetical protein
VALVVLWFSSLGLSVVFVLKNKLSAKKNQSKNKPSIMSAAIPGRLRWAFRAGSWRPTQDVRLCAGVLPLGSASSSVYLRVSTDM